MSFVCSHFLSKLVGSEVQTAEKFCKSYSCDCLTEINSYVYLFGWIHTFRFRDSLVGEVCQRIFAAKRDNFTHIADKCQRKITLTGTQQAEALQYLLLSYAPWQLAKEASLMNNAYIQRSIEQLDSKFKDLINDLYALFSSPSPSNISLPDEMSQELGTALLRYFALVRKSTDGTVHYLTWRDVLKEYKRTSAKNKLLLKQLLGRFKLNKIKAVVTKACTPSPEVVEKIQRAAEGAISTGISPQASLNGISREPSISGAESDHLRLNNDPSLKIFVVDLAIRELKQFNLKLPNTYYPTLRAMLSTCTVRHYLSTLYFFAESEQIFPVRGKEALNRAWDNLNGKLESLFGTSQDTDFFKLLEAVLLYNFTIFQLGQLQYSLEGAQDWRKTLFKVILQIPTPEKKHFLDQLLEMPVSQSKLVKGTLQQGVLDFIELDQKRWFTPNQLAYLFLYLLQNDAEELKGDYVSTNFLRQHMINLVETLQGFLGIPLSSDDMFSLYADGPIPNDFSEFIKRMMDFGKSYSDCQDPYLSSPTIMSHKGRRDKILNHLVKGTADDSQKARLALADKLWYSTYLYTVDPKVTPFYRIPFLNFPVLYESSLPLEPLVDSLQAPPEVPLSLSPLFGSSVHCNLRWLPSKIDAKFQKPLFWCLEISLIKSLHWPKLYNVRIPLNIPAYRFNQTERSIASEEDQPCAKLSRLFALFVDLLCEEGFGKSRAPINPQVRKDTLEFAKLTLTMAAEQAKAIQAMALLNEMSEFGLELFNFFMEVKKKFRQLPHLFLKNEWGNPGSTNSKLASYGNINLLDNNQIFSLVPGAQFISYFCLNKKDYQGMVEAIYQVIIKNSPKDICFVLPVFGQKEHELVVKVHIKLSPVLNPKWALITFKGYLDKETDVFVEESTGFPLNCGQELAQELLFLLMITLKSRFYYYHDLRSSTL